MPWTHGHAPRTVCHARRAEPWIIAPASEARCCPARHVWIRAARRLLGSCVIDVATKTCSPAPPAATQPCRAPVPQTSWPPPGRSRAAGRDKWAPSTPSRPYPRPPTRIAAEPLSNRILISPSAPRHLAKARQIQYRKLQTSASAQQTNGRQPVRLAAVSTPCGKRWHHVNRTPPRKPSELSIRCAMRQHDVASRAGLWTKPSRRKGNKREKEGDNRHAE